MKKTVVFAGAILACAPVMANGVNGTILDATIKDKAVSGADIIFQKNGENSQRLSTDGAGKFTGDISFDTNNPDVLMIVNRDGYSPLVVKCPCDGLTYAISPVQKSLDSYRVVLNWGANPLDLDSHLIFPGNHIDFRDMIGDNAQLDVDDTDGFGPETVTIEKRINGQKYIYAVHDYTNRDASGSSELSGQSDAKVFVYTGSTLVRTYYVPSNQTGNLWALFYIDENGEFHDINRFGNSSEDKNEQASKIQSLAGMGANIYTSQSEIDQSKRLNIRGEALYAQKDFPGAIELFERAVSINPDNAQAYSNLGIAYPKVGKNAEAMFANRKSITLATGINKDTVLANSYFNIAKIYEEDGDYANALENYKNANAAKEKYVYNDAIKRIESKMSPWWKFW